MRIETSYGHVCTFCLILLFDTKPPPEYWAAVHLSKAFWAFFSLLLLEKKLHIKSKTDFICSLRD